MEHHRLEQARRVFRSVHHEMNNPIGGALGCIEVLRAGCVEDAEVGTYLEAVRDGLSRVNRLASAYRAYLSDAGVRSGPVQVAGVIEQARVLIGKDAKMKGLRLQFDGTDAVARGSLPVCLRALVSLGLHVIDHATPRGQVRFTVAERDREIVIALQAEGVRASPSAVLLDDLAQMREQGGRIDIGARRVHMAVWDG